MQLHRALLFGQVHSSAKDVVAEFEVDTFPTLLVIKVGSGVLARAGAAEGVGVGVGEGGCG
jgi:hypothetical protein